ncbi:MAG: hypothetical protein ACRD21_14950 [Vicinamibacteria bacterium]
MTRKPSTKRNIWLLGPQYHTPFLRDLFPSFGVPDGPIAAVTAGWQEREGEDTELNKHLSGRAIDLELYRRADRVFRNDPELTQAHREMQRRLRELTRIYDTRLSFMRQSLLWLLQEPGEPGLLEPEREHALAQLRELDSWQLERITGVRSAFEDRYRPLARESVAREREEIARVLGGASALVITGGHVAVLLNRLKLFAIKDMIEVKTVIAWSAGAMALTERVVLFHDHPPEGEGNAGVMDRGLGLCPRLVALPDGKKRLDLEDRFRVSVLARRFQPDSCVVLGEGDCILFDGETWHPRIGALFLGADGGLEPLHPW